MNTSRKCHQIFFNHYPDAHNIPVPAAEDKAVEVDSFFSQLSDALPAFQVNKNLFTLLQDTAAALFYRRTKELLAHFDHLISNKEELALNLSQQCVRALPDDVRQLCTLAAEYHHASLHRFADWQEVFDHFPLIEKRVALHERHTMTVLSDVLSKLDKDKESLTNTFKIALFSIRKIHLFLDDFHQLGKSIVRIDFGTSSVIYKPVGADNAAFTLALLDLINAEIKDIHIGIPAFINKHEYSWHEYIAFHNPLNEQQILAYYRNIGASLLFFYLINGSKLDYKKIICVNSVPYFVDLETVLSYPQQTGLFTDSVLNTGIIPSLMGDSSDRYYCGIGVPDIEPGYLSGLPERMSEKINIPLFSDTPDIHEALVNAINDGFACMSQLIKDNQQIIPFIESFSSLKGRVYLRSSRSYYELMQLVKHPAYASDLDARKIYLSCLLYEETKPLDVIQYEHKALSEGRIPVFYINIASGKYYTADGKELNINGNHSFNSYLTKVCRMINTDDESALQKKLINLSLDTLYPGRAVIEKKQGFTEKTINFMAGEEIHYKQKDLILNVKRDVNGVKLISKMGSDIADGLSGAVFMQLCDIALNRTPQKEKKLQELYRRANKYNTNQSFGCFEMNGGLLYLEYLFHKNLIGWFDIALFNQRLFKIIDIIKQKDASADIISGMAGILIVCSRMYLLCPKKIYESAIKFIATAIMQKAIAINFEEATWHNRETGFARGNSGIAYALLLANNILKNKDINRLVISALKYEQRFKSDDGWKGLDPEDNSHSWYHGAPGIYLARKAMLDENYFDSDEISDMLYADIEHYNATKEERLFNQHPSLCHGAYGNAIIDPLSYADSLHLDYSSWSPAEDKSLMHGRPGALYAHMFINHSDREIPNLLLLK